MSRKPTPEDYGLPPAPHTDEEMEAARAAINTWQLSGSDLSEAPIDALTTYVNQALVSGKGFLRNIAASVDPTTGQAITLERKQGYLNAFREFLHWHGVLGADVAGFQAEAESLRAEAQNGEVEGSEKAAKWMKLAKMLREKEEMMVPIAEKVAELAAEEGLE
jgi:hypothetical protein